MNARLAYTAPPAPGPYDGKRLSPWRVALGVLVLVAIVAGSLFGYRLLVVDQVRAVTGAAWFAPYVDVTTTPFFAFEKPENDADRDVVLSFVVAAAADSCTPSWGGYYDLDEAARDVDLDRRIARLRESGGDVVWLLKPIEVRGPDPRLPLRQPHLGGRAP
jgi:chitinase